MILEVAILDVKEILADEFKITPFLVVQKNANAR